MALVGWTLVAGFVGFMVGAGGWRLEYEQPLDRSLPVMHADRRRLRWIHWWMGPSVVLTTAGLTGLAWLVSEPGAALAAGAYSLGAVLWVGALLFRLSVGEWAAERTVLDGSVPDVYEPLARWAGYGHAVHMVAAYLSAVPLAWAVEAAGLVPTWLAWAGSVWGLGLAVLFLVPRTRFAAAPPFWAHVFTFAVGLALLF
jgi:hypothetical protein